MAQKLLPQGIKAATVITLTPKCGSSRSELKERNLVAYYCIATCLGEIVVGLIFTSVSKKYHNFGLIPVFILTCIFFVMVTVLTLIYTPAQSSLKPTKELAILEPSAWIGILVGVLYGCLDGAACNARMVAAAKGLPESPAIAFSVAKFYQAGSAMIFLFLGSKMNIHQILYLSGFLMIISIGCYISFLRDLKVSRIGSITEGIEESGDEKILSE
ncbi:unnamed protein product, partial [Mesorhabditis belari]|uniref:Uncharacterized protein n=1 Tax=Mesorhabditis belari TaxID=2138241 RepID=A0AAF3FJZ5_9BILA